MSKKLLLITFCCFPKNVICRHATHFDQMGHIYNEHELMEARSTKRRERDRLHVAYYCEKNVRIIGASTGGGKSNLGLDICCASQTQCWTGGSKALNRTRLSCIVCSLN